MLRGRASTNLRPLVELCELRSHILCSSKNEFSAPFGPFISFLFSKSRRSVLAPDSRLICHSLAIFVTFYCVFGRRISQGMTDRRHLSIFSARLGLRRASVWRTSIILSARYLFMSSVARIITRESTAIFHPTEPSCQSNWSVVRATTLSGI
ncbi:MAG: hypothetical protein BMS9Abin05_1481 [Rhodothermia bacterium]|nr:MAG: hypothetical protein BMS9Abin05_1481 [Rhodothermia bacterium]